MRCLAYCEGSGEVCVYVHEKAASGYLNGNHYCSDRFIRTGGGKMSGDGFETNEAARNESRYDKSRKRKMSPAKC